MFSASGLNVGIRDRTWNTFVLYLVCWWYLSVYLLFLFVRACLIRVCIPWSVTLNATEGGIGVSLLINRTHAGGKARLESSSYRSPRDRAQVTSLTQHMHGIPEAENPQTYPFQMGYDRIRPPFIWSARHLGSSCSVPSIGKLILRPVPTKWGVIWTSKGGAV